MNATGAPRSKTLKWILTAGLVTTLLCAFAVLAFLFTACSFNKYVIAAGLPTPDRGYQTGSIYGYDVYIWECYQSKHIVVWRTSAEMSAGPFTREETACGATTPIEEKLVTETKRERDPHSFW